MLCRDLFFFFNDTATTEIYTLSLHDALPIFARAEAAFRSLAPQAAAHGVALLYEGTLPAERVRLLAERVDRKSTRLNSSHANISYAVFCLKKKNISYDYTDYPQARLLTMGPA